MRILPQNKELGCPIQRALDLRDIGLVYSVNRTKHNNRFYEKNAEILVSG
jgi:hypothetical protein